MKVNSLRMQLLSGQDPQVSIEVIGLGGPVLAIHVTFLSGNTPEIKRNSQCIALSLFLFWVGETPLSLIPT